MLSQIPCLAPLRGKGATSYEITPGPLDTPCWLWLGCLNSKGYAVRGTQDAGRYLVHRRVYENAHGQLAPGAQVHHRCEITRCVNPGHLDALVQLEHTREHRGHLTAAERAGELLAARGPLTVAVIARELGLRRGSLHVSLGRAVARGELTRVGHAWACADLELQEAAA